MRDRLERLPRSVEGFDFRGPPFPKSQVFSMFHRQHWPSQCALVGSTRYPSLRERPQREPVHCFRFYMVLTYNVFIIISSPKEMCLS